MYLIIIGNKVLFARCRATGQGKSILEKAKDIMCMEQLKLIPITTKVALLVFMIPLTALQYVPVGEPRRIKWFRLTTQKSGKVESIDHSSAEDPCYPQHTLPFAHY